MNTFFDHITEKLTQNDYTLENVMDQYVRVTAPEGEQIAIFYIDREMRKDFLRAMFEMFPDHHMLFVVDVKLVPEEFTDWKALPEFISLLHSLYFGRVYAWNGRQITAFHFDRDLGVTESAPIGIDNLLCMENSAWVRGYAGVYKIARFYDRAFWMKDNSREWRQERTSAGYERQRYAYESGYFHFNWQSPFEKPHVQTPTSELDFKARLFACKTQADVRTLYKQLAKQYHPDMNPGKDTTSVMQELNAAYDLVLKSFG